MGGYNARTLNMWECLDLLPFNPNWHNECFPFPWGNIYFTIILKNVWHSQINMFFSLIYSNTKAVDLDYTWMHPRVCLSVCPTPPSPPWKQATKCQALNSHNIYLFILLLSYYYYYLITEERVSGFTYICKTSKVIWWQNSDALNKRSLENFLYEKHTETKGYPYMFWNHASKILIV